MGKKLKQHIYEFFPEDDDANLEKAFRYFVGYYKSPITAKEVLYDALLYCLDEENDDPKKPIINFYSWFLTKAKNDYTNKINKAQNRHKKETNEWFYKVFSNKIPTESEYKRRKNSEDRRDEIEMYINENLEEFLPSNKIQKTIFLLRVIEDKSEKETMKELHKEGHTVNRGYVATNLSRAKEKIQENILKKFPDYNRNNGQT